MPTTSEDGDSTARQANSQSTIRARVSSGLVSWTGPLLLTVGRSALILASQAAVALIFMLHRNQSPWLSAGRWWTVYGTLADAGCLALLWKFTRAEGTNLRDLIGPIRWRHGRDVWTGLGILLLIFPLFIVGGMLSNLLVFGRMSASPGPAGAVHYTLPLWGMIYSLSVWWIIWTPTEQMTYQGYVLPRLCALTGRSWVALVVVGFWWSLQHSFLPFVPDWRIVIWRFVMIVPGVICTMLIYLRTRRLAPFIVAQWPMDIVVAVMSTGS
jgi:hypothetical protein